MLIAGRVRPVSALLARTITPLSGAPCASVMRPEMAPFVVCEEAGCHAANVSRQTTILVNVFIKRTDHAFGEAPEQTTVVKRPV